MTVADIVGTEALQEQAHRHLLMHFTRNGAFGPGGKPLLVLERGEGAYVFDTDGNRAAWTFTSPMREPRPAITQKNTGGLLR